MDHALPTPRRASAASLPAALARRIRNIYVTTQIHNNNKQLNLLTKKWIAWPVHGQNNLSRELLDERGCPRCGMRSGGQEGSFVQTRSTQAQAVFKRFQKTSKQLPNNFQTIPNNSKQFQTMSEHAKPGSEARPSRQRSPPSPALVLCTSYCRVYGTEKRISIGVMKLTFIHP